MAPFRALTDDNNNDSQQSKMAFANARNATQPTTTSGRDGQASRHVDGYTANRLEERRDSWGLVTHCVESRDPWLYGREKDVDKTRCMTILMRNSSKWTIETGRCNCCCADFSLPKRVKHKTQKRMGDFVRKFESDGKQLKPSHEMAEFRRHFATMPTAAAAVGGQSE